MVEQAISSPSALWEAFLQAVEGSVSAHVLRVWLRPVRCAAFDGRTVTLEVRDQFFCDWMADHYLAFIRKELSAVARTPVEVRWAINPELDADNDDDADAAHLDEDGEDNARDADDETKDGHVDEPAPRRRARRPSGASAAAAGRGAGDALDEGAANDGTVPVEHNTEASAGRAAARRRTSSAADVQIDGEGPSRPVTGRTKSRGPRAAEAADTEATPRTGSPAAGAGVGHDLASRRRKLDASSRGRRSQPASTGSGKRTTGSGYSGGLGTENHKQLNKRYVFDNFVQGPSNQFAFAACHAAAQNPGRSYNPLFIYGGVGLGKTHLLSAIGHHILANKKDAKIIYTSSEQLTNEVINAALNGKLGEFRAKYLSNGDAILVDDIQLIAGKERTQHEFFHIFNSLYDSQRQIVVTSDKLPHEIPEIEERLRNRFQWGLIADVQPPEIETRIAILRKKAEVEHFELSNDVAFFLARSIRSNVRELEGALVRIMAHASLNNTPVTIEYARAALGDILQHVPSEVTIESIQKTVAHYFSLRVSELKSSRRQKALVRARQMAMYLCRKHLGSSYPELGSRFGDKDHTTVLASCSRVTVGLGTDVNMRMQLDEIEQRINFDAHQ